MTMLRISCWETYVWPRFFRTLPIILPGCWPQVELSASSHKQQEEPRFRSTIFSVLYHLPPSCLYFSLSFHPSPHRLSTLKPFPACYYDVASGLYHWDNLTLCPLLYVLPHRACLTLQPTRTFPSSSTQAALLLIRLLTKALQAYLTFSQISVSTYPSLSFSISTYYLLCFHLSYFLKTNSYILT